MVRLPDPERSYAILIGSSTYRSRELPDLPAVRNNLAGLATELADPAAGGLSSDRCVVVADPGSVRDAYRILRKYATSAEDTLVVYFAGHGLIGPARNELFLALSDTDRDELQVSALPFELVRDVLRDCPATNRVLILDCCFSGRAARGFMATATEAVLGQVEVAGTYTLAATSANATAAAPPGATHTAFTGELLSLLRNGIPGGPKLLTLGTIYRRLRHTMTIRGLPVPTQLGTDTAELLALTRNRALQPRLPAPKPTIQPPAPARKRKALVGPALLMLGVTGALLLLNGLPEASNDAQSQASRTTGPPITTTTTTTVTTPSRSELRSIPVRVFNNTSIPGLAARVADDLGADGWFVTHIGNYAGPPVPVSTVYYHQGALEQAAARDLATTFALNYEPNLDDPGNLNPGILVVVQADYLT
jgi:hypothetical protein